MYYISPAAGFMELLIGYLLRFGAQTSVSIIENWVCPDLSVHADWRVTLAPFELSGCHLSQAVFLTPFWGEYFLQDICIKRNLCNC